MVYFQWRSRNCSKIEQFLLALKIEINFSTPRTLLSCQFSPSLAKATEQDSSQLPGQSSLTTRIAISDAFFFFFLRYKNLELWKGWFQVPFYMYGPYLSNFQPVFIHACSGFFFKKIIGVFITVHSPLCSFWLGPDGMWLWAAGIQGEPGGLLRKFIESSQPL